MIHQKMRESPTVIRLIASLRSNPAQIIIKKILQEQL